MRPKTRVPARLRAVIAAAIFSFTTFAVSITPVALPITGPLGLAPKAAQAAYCASDPAFTGRLTASSSSTVAVSRITNGTVYGYLSNVDAAWSCTLYYRYSGLAYNTSSTTGTFDYGALINSTSVACNWVVGSTDYLKGNNTTDCPDYDAEYALPIVLSPEGTYINNAAHNVTGQFSWVHSDCSTTTFYGAESKKTGQTFSTAITGNRPGANCDPIGLDNTATAQTVTYDNTPPAIDFVTPDEAASTAYSASSAYTVTFSATDAVAGFGGANGWKLQRQIAPLLGPNQCDAYANDPAGGGLVTGTTNAANQTSGQTLVDGNCYRWVLSAVDQNGKVATAHVSGQVLVDVTPPTADFTSPEPGTLSTQGDSTYDVSWDETENDSGVQTRSLQRQKVAPTGATCPTSGWVAGNPHRSRPVEHDPDLGLSTRRRVAHRRLHIPNGRHLRGPEQYKRAPDLDRDAGRGTDHKPVPAAPDGIDQQRQYLRHLCKRRFAGVERVALQSDRSDGRPLLSMDRDRHR